MIELSNLDKVIREAIQAVEKSKEELNQTVEDARQEYEQVKSELNTVQDETTTVSNEANDLERQYARARIGLMEIQHDFHHYQAEQVKNAYERTHNKQIEVLGKREQEKLLRLHHKHLEQNLKILEGTIRRSEKLVPNMSLALKLLSYDLEIIRQQISEMKKMQALGLSIIRAQEEERRRVAREIHDGPAQSMANIVLRAEFCLKLLEKNPLLVREELFSLVELVRHSLQDVRKIIFDLRPMVLDDLGLVPALKHYIEQYNEEYGIFVETIVLGKEQRLDNSLEVALFRVIQESLTNIKKYANVKNAVIKIEFLADKVNIVVRDNGCGFNKDIVLAEKQEDGFGLIGMRERIQLLRGKFDIMSVPGQGTEIIFNVPTTP